MLTQTVALIHPQMNEYAAAQVWMVPYNARYLTRDELKTMVVSYLQSPDEISQKKRFEVIVIVIEIDINWQTCSTRVQTWTRVRTRVHFCWTWTRTRT